MALDTTPAEQLKARHAANVDPPPHVTIEEVKDQDDIEHPPPIIPPQGTNHTAASSQPLSDVARGKQKISPAQKSSLNFDCEEAFPSLGPARPASTPPTQTWSRKPAVLATNGTPNGSVPIAGRQSGNLGVNEPGHNSSASVPLGTVNLPGCSVERLAFAPSQITPRSQLKKPIQEVLRDINKKSKAQVVLKEGAGGQIIFQGTGPQAAVRQALKEVAQQVGSKQAVKIAVPISVRPFLIGKQGQTIQGITRRTGARINVPKQEEPVDEDDEDATIDILVEGDAVSAEMARREIQKIVDERTSSSSMSLKDIPPEYYPFLAGPRQANLANLVAGTDLDIHIPSYHTWKTVPPAQPDIQGQPAVFVPQPSLPIRIVGDRQAAQAARNRIDRQVAALCQQLTLHQLQVERGRHQFILGQDGDSLQDLMAETGCSVIVPPVNDESETLYIIGPADRIESGVNKVMDVAASMAVSNVDVARQHARAPPSHAHDLGRYLIERQVISELERQYGASFVLPSARSAPASWQIFSLDGRQAMKARADAMNLIVAHPPSRFHVMPVNSFYHRHLEQQAPRFREEHGIHILFPKGDADDHEITLVYEAPGYTSDYTIPRQAPTPAQAQEHQKAVRAAAEMLQALIGDDADVVSCHVEAPQKYHEKVQRFVDRDQRLFLEQFSPQLVFDRQAKTAVPGFQILGRPRDVNAWHEHILEFLEQEKKDELERGFTTSFEYPHKFARHLIGRRGDNIKKLQDEFDVDINYTEGKVDLKGPQAKCTACKSHILNNVKKLEDEATHHIKVPQQYHYELKGFKGSQVVRLQDRYNVHINFPRQAAPPADDADAASEISLRNQPSQASDVVIIKGPKRGADEAREELLNLLQYIMDNSHTATVSVASKQVPSLIGAGGQELDLLRNETNCRIDMPKKEEVELNDRVEVRLKGTKKQVEDAKKLLLERARSFDNTVTESLDVDPKLHRLIIGPSGSTLAKIVLDAGGPEDRRLMNRMVTFPKQGSNDYSIRLQGAKSVVEQIRAAINSLVAERAEQITELMNIAPELHRHLIGPSGSIRRKIERDCGVEVDIPRTDVSDSERSTVRLTGKPENIAKAREHIDLLLKAQATETVLVPVHLHHSIADEGNFFRRLRTEQAVAVDHAGHKPPERVNHASMSRARTNGTGSMPLITDDAPASTSHSWEIIDPPPAATGNKDLIPWVLRGKSENLSKARELIERALENASKPSCTGYLILPDPRLYRFIIGPSGSIINNIRQQTGVQIQVPRQGSGHEAVEIKGSRDGVEQAKDLVLEAVEQRQGNTGPGGRRN